MKIMLNRATTLSSIALFLSIISACVSDDPGGELPIDEQAVSGKADGVVWRKVFDCEGAVLDVNSNERRQLQLVVRDHGAADYLLTGGAAGVTPEFTSKGELIFHGRTEHGVFHPWDFIGMLGVNATYPGSDAFIGATISVDGDNIVATSYFNNTINWVFRGCH